MDGDIDRILLTHDQIHTRLREMAAEIARAYDRDEIGLTIVPVLSGSIIFVADLIRELPLKMKIGLVQISSYPGSAIESQGPQTRMEITGAMEGRHVLIVDDILDSGNTLRYVRRQMAQRNPASIQAAVLLRKPGKAPPDVTAEFVGFDIEDAFVVGYGLDFDDHYRNYPHIGVLRSELMP